MSEQAAPTADPMDLLELMFPSTVRAIAIAAEYRIAELLAAGPRSVAELADESGTHAPSLHKVLQLLTEDEIFAEVGPGVFANTPRSTLLRPDVPASLSSMARLVGEQWLWDSWGRLDHCVRTGQAAFEHVYHTRLWPWLARNPAAATVFNGAMTDISEALGPSVARAYPGFGAAQVIADLGGGQGTFLASILGEYPAINTGVLVDLPAVVASAQQRPELAPLVRQGRLAFYPADFFIEVPSDIDTYVTKQVMHSWNDDQVVALLSRCRASAPCASFAAVEMVHRTDVERFVKNFDLVMLVTMAGFVRTEDDFAKLFARAGYELRAVLPTDTAFSVIEAAPVG